MPKIVLKKKAEIQKEMPIRPFQTKLTIGSEGDNDLVIFDKKVSLHHLLIEKEKDDYFLIDKDSAFGTLLNGEKLQSKKLLKQGDEILIGEHTLIFEDTISEKDHEESPASPAEESPIATVEADTSAGKDEEAELLQEDAEPPVQLQMGSISHYLIAIHGPYTGKKYQLNFGLTKIGRDKMLNDIVIRETVRGEVDNSISRRHATIFFENDAFYITDKRSKTRTYVNRERLNEDSVVKLSPNDEIEIVSDQQSTIFRFVDEGHGDFSRPKKAGNRWVRYSPIALTVLSGIALLIFFIVFLKSWKNLSAIMQKAVPFKAVEQKWFAEDLPMEVFNQPEEIARMVGMLTPVIGDVNGDGINDLIYSDRIGDLQAVDGATLKPLWRHRDKYRLQTLSHLVLSDMNQNSLPDVVIGSADSRLYAIDGGSGAEIWSSPYIGGDFSGAPLIADLNGDRLPDVFSCTTLGKIHVGYGGSREPNWVSYSVDSEIRCTPSAGDFNHDGIAEAIFGTENGVIYIFSGNLNKSFQMIDINEEMQKAKGSFFEDHQIRGHIAVGDLNDDNYPDIVLTSLQGGLLVISMKTMKRLWHDDVSAEDPYAVKLTLPIALGDLDGDQKLDVVVITLNNKILAYRGSGQSNAQKKILWAFVPESYEIFAADPVIADINKDGRNDVIAAGIYGGITILNGWDGKILWNKDTAVNINEAIVSTPVIADMKGDRSVDVLFRRADGQLHKINSNAKIQKSAILWGQLYHDAGHSGAVDYHDAGGSTYIVLIIISLMAITALLWLNLKSLLRQKRLQKNEFL